MQQASQTTSRTWRGISRVGGDFGLFGTARALCRVVRVRGALAQLEQLAQLVTRQHCRVELALRSKSEPNNALAQHQDTHLRIHQVLQPFLGKLSLIDLKMQGRAKSAQALDAAERSRPPSPQWCRCSRSGTQTRAFSGRRATRARPPACRWPGSSQGQTAPGGCRR